eukprot:8468880-Pyramimonas_sp.AAC.1
MVLAGAAAVAPLAAGSIVVGEAVPADIALAPVVPTPSEVEAEFPLSVEAVTEAMETDTVMASATAWEQVVDRIEPPRPSDTAAAKNV